MFLSSLEYGREPFPGNILIDVHAVDQAVIRCWRAQRVQKIRGGFVEPVGQQHGPKVNVPVFGRGTVDYDGADDPVGILEGEV